MADESAYEPIDSGSALAAEIALVVEAIEATGRSLSDYPMLLNPDQVGELVGRKVSTIRTLLNSGELPHRLVGRTKQVSKAELVLWLVRREETAS